MGRKRHTAEQIIGKLRTAEIELAKGLGTAEVVRKLGIAERTSYGAESRSSQNASTSVDFTALTGTRFSLAPPRRLT